MGCISTPKIVKPKSILTPQFLYDEILIEIHADQSVKIDTIEINNLTKLLYKYKIAHSTSYIIKKYDLNLQQINSHQAKFYEKKQRLYPKTSIIRGKKRLNLYMLATIAEYNSKEYKTIVGLKYGPTSILILKNRLDSTVMLHEIGHVLGIASGRGINSNPDRPGHCDNRKCIMFWRPYDNSLFDKDCIAVINSRLKF